MRQEPKKRHEDFWIPIHVENHVITIKSPPIVAAKAAIALAALNLVSKTKLGG